MTITYCDQGINNSICPVFRQLHIGINSASLLPLKSCTAVIERPVPEMEQNRLNRTNAIFFILFPGL